MITEPEPDAVPLAPAPDLRVESRAEPTGSARTLYSRLGKRTFDTIAASLGLVATFPLLLICAVAVRVDSSGPIFFRQRRIGQRGKPFDILKFRTMVDQTEKEGLRITADGDSRITAAGKWLRKRKLDELPQLLNVMVGDMSLVGPRGEVPEYVTLYNADQLRVLEVKPGITGPAALTFIDEEKILAGQPDKEAFYVRTLMPQKLELDLSYCQRVSFGNDLRLILATLRRLFGPGNLSSNASTLSSHTVSVGK